MNQRAHPRRQIYNRQQLNKQTLKNRQIMGPNLQKKSNIAQDIVKEIEKEENDLLMDEGEVKEKAGDEDKSLKSEKGQEQEEKEEKKKKERLKLDAKTLLYNNDNGLRKFYEVITKTKFENPDNTKNLDKLIKLTRNWHFMLFPNYDFDFFTNKLIKLGKQAPTKSFMSRVRRIYKGEADWDIIYDEQAQILGKASIMNDKKEFINPNPENKDSKENKKNNNNQLKNDDKKDEMEFNEEDQGIIQDLLLNDENVEENDKKDENKEKNNNKNNVEEEFDVKDEDFDNFPEDYNPEEEYEKKNLSSNLKKSNQNDSLNSDENKIKNINLDIGNQQEIFSGMKIDENESPQFREHSNFKEKRTSDQIFGANEKEENNADLEPESMKKKMILEK